MGFSPFRGFPDSWLAAPFPTPPSSHDLLHSGPAFSGGLRQTSVPGLQSLTPGSDRIRPLPVSLLRGIVPSWVSSLGPRPPSVHQSKLWLGGAVVRSRHAIRLRKSNNVSDRKRVVEGKGVDPGGRWIINKKINFVM